MEQLRANLLYVLNTCELPIDAAYYVTKDVFRELEDMYSQELIKKKQAALKAEQEQDEEDAVEEE